MHVRTLGVLGGGGEPANHRVAGVFRRPVRVGGRVLGDDPVLEAGRLEGGLPVLDGPLDPGNEPARGRGIDVIGDRLDRLRELGRRVFLLQPVAGNEGSGLGLLLGPPVIDHVGIEVSDPAVEEPGHHRLLGQLHHAPVHDQRGGGGTGAQTEAGRVGAGGRAGGRIDGEEGLDLDVDRKGQHPVDERPRAIGIAAVDPGAGAQLGRRRGEEPGHVDDRGAVLAPCVDVEGAEHRAEVALGHGPRDRETGVGVNPVVDAAEQDPAVAALPAHHLAARGLLPAVDRVGRRLGHPGHHQDVPAQHASGDLEEELASDLMGDPKPGAGLGVGRDHPVVGTGVGLAAAGRLTAGAARGAAVTGFGLGGAGVGGASRRGTGGSGRGLRRSPSATGHDGAGAQHEERPDVGHETEASGYRRERNRPEPPPGAPPTSDAVTRMSFTAAPPPRREGEAVQSRRRSPRH